MKGIVIGLLIPMLSGSLSFAKDQSVDSKNTSCNGTRFNELPVLRYLVGAGPGQVIKEAELLPGVRLSPPRMGMGLASLSVEDIKEALVRTIVITQMLDAMIDKRKMTEAKKVDNLFPWMQKDFEKKYGKLMKDFGDAFIHNIAYRS